MIVLVSTEVMIRVFSDSAVVSATTSAKRAVKCKEKQNSHDCTDMFCFTYIKTKLMRRNLRVRSARFWHHM